MTYSAPRQGLFAIIILVSVSLHVLFFVISQEWQTTEKYRNIAEREALALSQELSAPLNAVDRVSMSVIAKRYIQDDNIAFIGVYDSTDNLIIPVGKDTAEGLVAKEMITSNDSVLGSIIVQTKPISRASIISENWLFLIGIVGLHTIILLIYGYLARPTKELKDEIAHDVRDRLLANGILSLPQEKKEPVQKPTSSAIKSTAVTKQTKSPTPPPQAPNPIPEQNPEQKSALIATQILFDDHHGLLDTVGRDTKFAYFALCDEILINAIKGLLALPVLSGVSLHSINRYTDKGAIVYLHANNSHAKVATASVMLARLMIMLGQIVYEKHRELKRFALPVRTMVSSPTHQNSVIAISKKHRENPLILLSEAALSEISIYGELGKLSEPTSVDERECRYLKRISNSTANRLNAVRDQVLLSNNSSDPKNT